MKKEGQTLTLNYVSDEEILNEIIELQTAKTIHQNDIPTKILKEVFARHFHGNICFCIENSIFPSGLKVADVTQHSKEIKGFKR